MKFSSPEDQVVLQRLQTAADFRYFVGKLGAEYERCVTAMLTAPSDELESKRGEARAYYVILKSLGAIK